MNEEQERAFALGDIVQPHAVHRHEAVRAVHRVVDARRRCYRNERGGLGQGVGG